MTAKFLSLTDSEYAIFISQLKQANERLNAFNFIDENKKSGKIISVKDNICVKGMPATASSKILQGYMPGFNATAVQRLENSGFSVIGKTNMDEFGFGSFGLNSEHPAKNPFNEEYVAGGSSSGSAVATALIKEHVSIAESTGGSISAPAAFCGVVGLTPTYGAISRYGLIDYASSLDKIGFIGKSADNLRDVMEKTVGSDPKDTTSLSNVISNKNPHKLYVIDNLVENIDESIKDRFEDLLAKLSAKDYEIEHVNVDYLEYSVPAYYILSMSEASTNLAKYQGFKYGFKVKDFSLNYNEFFMSARKQFGKEAKRRVILGTFIRSKSIKQRYYEKALAIRHAIIARMKKFLNDGFIIMPSMPIFTPKISEVSDISPVEAYSMDMLTVPPNLCGFPHMSFPYFYEKGMPLGAQIITDHFNDYSLLDFLSEWESGFKYKFKEEIG
ncbi:MAG: amidase family protein [Candidatus Parvarchaeota archaeon]|nr:amidase family protein [Candidatus Parvarchaeum tengchongense]MCW1298858.1 amidase family protein [Candidatus Parvarchaeum tengchongense]MCW1312404.1 amidase family protein [Candidatus Parvarchaeum tengchongense]